MTEALNLTCQYARQASRYSLCLEKPANIRTFTPNPPTAHKLKRESVRLRGFRASRTLRTEFGAAKFSDMQ